LKNVTGTLTYIQKEGCTLTGSFTLHDRWDFNVEGFSSHRAVRNELETIAGRFLLPGRPFDVTSDPVPLNIKEPDTIIVPDRR
jgi:deferrochelatase/peroxidase EfeB